MPILRISAVVLSLAALFGCSEPDTAAHISDATAAHETEDVAMMQDNTDHIEQELLEESVAIANGRLPMDIGNNTRLDKVTAGPGRRIVFHATLVDRDSGEQRSGDLSSGFQTLIKTSCGDPSIQSFLDDKIAVTYKYRALDGTDITSIDVTKSLCINAQEREGGG